MVAGADTIGMTWVAELPEGVDAAGAPKRAQYD